MERSEPTLVPEWLRSTGNVAGGGNSVHHFSSSSSHSDGPSAVHHTRTRNSKCGRDFHTPHAPVLDRTSSSNSRRSSSNGFAKHAYSSFNRSHRDKDRERDKERLSYGDPWDCDSSDPLGNILSSRMEKDLRRSHSLVSRKQSELLPRRVSVDSKINSNSNHSNGNGVLSGGSTGKNIKKAVFEKDFPSLGSEERQGVPDVGRVSSPGLSSAGQSLPVGSSTLIGGEGWTSALAEVPPIIASSGSGSFSAQTGSTPSVTAGLNMAEALAQAPSRAQTAPQLSVKTQRLDELTIKKSKQLIPVTPSMPKSSVLNFSDKSKPKTAARISEMNIAVKNGQQQPSSLHHANQSLHGGNAKSDVPKTSHGKLLVLKPAWENGVPHTPKDGASLTSNANSRPANNQLAVIPPVASAASRSPKNPKLSTAERKATAVNLISGFTMERKPSLSQTQSRNDFFNLLKKKTSMNTYVLPADSGPDMSFPTVEKPGEVTKEVISAPVSPRSIENGVEVTTNGDSHEQVQRFSDMGEKTMSRYAAVDPDEEAAFLRSLGWEENSGEDEGLTEDEIKAFYQEFEKRGMQLKLPQYHATGASSELSLSNSGSEASLIN